MNRSRTILDRTYQTLTLRPVYHGLFWAVLFAFMVFGGSKIEGNPGDILFAEILSLCFFAVLVYANLYYLIPNYLAKRAFVYLMLVMILCAIVTPLEVFVLYVKFSENSDFRTFLVSIQLDIYIGNIFVTLISTVLRLIMDWWRYQNEKQVLLTQTMQSELRFLKSQINPHFLFNTLNNLYALTLKKSDKAPEIVLKLSEIMRYMLYECNEKRVLLSKEILYMHNYLDLERLRQPKEADISFTVEGNISDQMIAPLLFVPFVENSFKHGLNLHVKDGGFVRMYLRVHGEDMEFHIENSKADALPRMDHRRSGGIGLVNVRQRLQILYPENHTLIVNDEPDVYAVTLLLKLI